MTIQVEERQVFAPVCPFCEKRLSKVIAQKLASSFLSKRMLFCCPHCHKVLGVTHRKGLMAS